MTNPAKRQINAGFLLRLGGTIIALALLFYLLSEQGWEEILLAIKKITIWQFTLAFALQLLSRMAICGRWHVLLRGARLPVTFGQTTRLTFAGLFATNFLPTTIGGDVIRLAGSVQLRFDGAVSAASLVVDRLVGMAGMAMALPFGIPAFNAALQQSAITQMPAVISSVALASRRDRFAAGARKWRRKLLGFIQRMLQSLKLWISHPGSLLQALGFTWIHMLCLFASLWLLLNSMGEPVSFWLIAGMWSAVYFITLLPISINAYGLQELSLAFIFTRVGGVSASSALSLAILIRTLFMLASLPGAAFVPGIMAARSTLTKNTQSSPVPGAATAQDNNPGAPIE